MYLYANFFLNILNKSLLLQGRTFCHLIIAKIHVIAIYQCYQNLETENEFVRTFKEDDNENNFNIIV